MLYITGDVHYPFDSLKLYKAKSLLKANDILIVAGDMGLCWSNEDLTKHRIAELSGNINYTLLFVDGNHEHHEILNTYPECERYSGSVHKLADNIYHLMRGETYVINNKRVLTIGGARSTDKQRRISNVDWFPQEELTATEMNDILSVITGKYYDLVISHDAPTWVANTLYFNTILKHSPTQVFLNEVSNVISYKYWYFGHHHKDLIVPNTDGSFICLYNSIRKALLPEEIIYSEPLNSDADKSPTKS